MTATRTIGSIATFSKGSGLAKSDLVADGAHPCVHYGELFTRYGAIIDVVRSRTGRDLPVKSEVGDVLMPTSDVTPRGLAKASALLSANVGLGGDVLIIRPDRAKADSRFLAYAIRHNVNQVLKLVRGSTVYHLYAADMRHFELPSLPLAEQARVADALKDSDDLIDSLERLITKKQAIKQGMMQELLTGRTRLPGFDGHWKETRLGDGGTCIRGVGYDPGSDLSSSDRPYAVRLLRSNNVQSSRVNYHDLQFVHERRVRSDQVLRTNDIVICMANGSRALVGKAALFAGVGGNLRYTIGAFMGVFRCNPTLIDASFAIEVMGAHSFRRWLDLILSGSSINNLRPGDIESFVVPMPDLVEQRAIADVLAEANREIDLLRQRLAKARDVKQGMMQELLTGRTRLPVQETVA